jgi:hypothetical protein
MLRTKHVYSYLHSWLRAITTPISTCSSQPVFHWKTLENPECQELIPKKFRCK